MAIDWHASKEEWISEVTETLFPKLIQDRRFPDAQLIIDRFEDAVRQWRRSEQIRPLINNGNELAAAAAILNQIAENDILRYEPRLKNTPKSIDFLIEKIDGSRCWLDFKTIAPGWRDDDASWQRFEAIATDFPENARLIVQRDLGGAAISGQLIKARWSFIQRTIEAEKKIAFLTPEEQGPVTLIFCSSGIWNLDDLEDFADFYRTGRFSEDDWARNAIQRYMNDEGILFSRTLANFSYLKRQHDEVQAQCFVREVRGPNRPFQ